MAENGRPSQLEFQESIDGESLGNLVNLAF